MIECREMILDFKTVSSFDSPVGTFVLRNIGSQPLIIFDIRPDCGSCVDVVEFSQNTTILPSDHAEIKIKLLASKLDGNIYKSIVVQSNDPLLPVLLLHVRAEVLQQTPNHNARTNEE